MSRSLVAALFLLVVSGSGAAFLWFAGSAGDVREDVAAIATTPPAPVTPEPATATPLARDTPSAAPAESHPWATLPVPAGLSSAERPYPTPVESREPVDSPQPPRWTVASSPGWAPTWLSIPDIGIDAPIGAVSVTETGEMEAPARYEEIGWYRLGALPGEPGRAVLAGHVDSKTGPAVFYRLRELVPGARIEVRLGADVQALRYFVREMARYPEDEAPLERIFGPADVSELILITCAGDFDFELGVYADRLVVYADLVPDVG